MINGSIEMRDALLCMGIILCILGRLCMFEGRLGMSHEHIRMSLFAVINGFFRMTNGLSQVILCNGKSRGHQDGGSKAKDQSENSSVHGCVPPYFHSSNNEGLGPRDLIQLVSLSSFNIRQGGENARTC
jgi:hypothetical protein